MAGPQLPYLPTYLAAKQNGTNIIDRNNFRYRPGKKIKKKTYYTCVEKKKMKCRATVIVDDESKQVVKHLHHHNHDSRLLKAAVKEREDAAILAAGNTMERPRQVLGQCNSIIPFKNQKHLLVICFTLLLK